MSEIRKIVTCYCNEITRSDSITNICFEEAKTLATVETTGEDYDGYPKSETLEVLQNKSGDLLLVRGSIVDGTQFSKSDSYFPLNMNCTKGSLILSLRELADQLEKTYV